MISNAPTRSQIVEEAKSWLDTPYLHQASTKGHGADCLGLVRGIWRSFYGEEPINTPAYSHDWIKKQGDTLLVSSLDKWMARKSGDVLPAQVLLFRIEYNGAAQHLTIASGQDRFIHAYAGRAVCESWYSRWWQRRLIAQFDFPGVS